MLGMHHAILWDGILSGAHCLGKNLAAKNPLVAGFWSLAAIDILINFF
jgi:hypothetical protein